MTTKASIQPLRRALFALHEDREEHLYAVLDGASMVNLTQALSRLGQESLCLYRGELDPDTQAIAPRLVRLDPDAPFTDFVLSGWGRHWGVFALSSAEPMALHRHFRKLQMVNSVDNQSVLFRYYDPRVLADFLTACTRTECEQVFGPVTQFIMEGDETHEIIRLTPAAEGAHGRAYDLRDGSEMAFPLA